MKKNGFTLIELLAVIIVLAIIALIATPIIFNVIENAKIKSMENSAYGLIDAVRTKYAEELLNDTDGTIDTVGCTKDLVVAGESATGGVWKINNAATGNVTRGIRVAGVTFASMNGYVCNSDGEKVKCEKTSNPGTELDTTKTIASCKKQ